ncbi:MAG: hypothetical protein V2A78_12185 [bacterium]
MKKIFYYLCLVVLVLFGSGSAWAQKSHQPTVIVDEKEIPGEKLVVNNEIYMPVSDLLDVLKVPIHYEASSGTWFVNGEEAAVKVIRRNGQDYALVKMLAARAKLSYLYDGKTYTLEIKTAPPSAPAYSTPAYNDPVFPSPMAGLPSQPSPFSNQPGAALDPAKSPLLSPFNAAIPNNPQSSESAQDLSMPLINNFLSPSSSMTQESITAQSVDSMALYDKVEINILVTDLEKKFNAAMDSIPTMKDAPRAVMKFCRDCIARVQGHSTLKRFFPIEQQLIVAAFNTIYNSCDIMTQFPLDAKKMEEHNRLWTEGTTLLIKTFKDLKGKVAIP